MEKDLFMGVADRTEDENRDRKEVLKSG